MSDSVATGDERIGKLSDFRRRELADFLRTRREKLKPEALGFDGQARRRTPGLRREEVAKLAGVGTTWYTWLEQARDILPSADVLNRLALALQLDRSETDHLFRLAGRTAPTRLAENDESVSPAIQRVLSQSIQVPTLVLGARWDILGHNTSAEELFEGLKSLPEGRKNWIFYVFCRMKTQFLLDWESQARTLVAEFRSSLTELMESPWVSELVDALKTESVEFNRWWREHDVRDRAPVLVGVRHPIKGQVVFERTVLKLADQPRQKLLLFTPVPPSS
jgi:transcriptional regulator with XRE-family HTH domain